MWRPFWMFRWPVVGRHSFMARSCGDDMTKPNFLRGSPSDCCFLRATYTALVERVRPKGVWTLSTFLSTAGFLTHIWIPSSWFCLHLVHAVFRFGRDDFATQAVDLVGRSGVQSTVSGASALWRPTQRQSGGVWDPDSSSGRGPGLVPSRTLWVHFAARRGFSPSPVPGPAVRVARVGLLVPGETRLAPPIEGGFSFGEILRKVQLPLDSLLGGESVVDVQLPAAKKSLIAAND
ncbi:hypothetical protein AHiyo6_31440, partial [Arthrobacter sp. Hiyo6]